MRIAIALMLIATAASAQVESTTPPTTAVDAAETPEVVPSDTESPVITADEPVVDRMVAYENFLTSMDEDEWVQATDWAEQVVELTESEFGANHEEMVTPLNNLAVAQMRAGLYKLAETTFVRSLDIIDSQLGIFHPRLVNPLTGLGTLMNTLGRHDDALDAFQRAQHVQHRMDGVLGLEQLETVNAISQTRLLKGEYLEARNSRLFGLRIQRNEYGPRSAGYSAALSRLGGWYIRNGMFSLARIAFNDAVRVMEVAKSPNDRALIAPLRGLASAISVELGARKKPGQEALERVVLIESTNPESTPENVVKAELELADWIMRHGKPRDALPRYQRVWSLLEESGDLSPKYARAFDRPVRLTRLPFVPADVIPPLEDGGAHYAQYQFTVTEQGRTQNVQVVDSTLSPAARNIAKRSLRSARYRPRLVDGEPIATANVQVRQEF